MQRKFSEPNTYIDGLPSQDRQELLYDDVEMSELTAAVRTPAGGGESSAPAAKSQHHVTLALREWIPSHRQGHRCRNLGATRLSCVLGRAVRLAWGLVWMKRLGNHPAQC